MLLHSFASWLAIAPVALAFPRADPPTAAHVPRQVDGDCTNSPRTRFCWSNGYSIATDFEEKWPTTGNTVTVSKCRVRLNITESNMSVVQLGDLKHLDP
jgi:hypothetical protein